MKELTQEFFCSGCSQHCVVAGAVDSRVPPDIEGEDSMPSAPVLRGRSSKDWMVQKRGGQ